MQTDLFTVHSHENNSASQSHLDEHSARFSRQCRIIYNLLMEGKEVTRMGLMTEHGIMDGVRRIHDLKDNKVVISERWENGCKVWFCSLADRTANLLK